MTEETKHQPTTLASETEPKSNLPDKDENLILQQDEKIQVTETNDDPLTDILACQQRLISQI